MVVGFPQAYSVCVKHKWNTHIFGIDSYLTHKNIKTNRNKEMRHRWYIILLQESLTLRIYHHTDAFLCRSIVNVTNGLLRFFVNKTGFFCCSVAEYWRNVAVGKPSNMSSTLMWSGNLLEARLANDGDRNPGITQLSCSESLKQYAPWWMVDLQERYLILGVRLTSRDKNRT